MRRTIVIVPTFNERDNIEGVIRRVRASVPEAEVLVVDDGSPDGTGHVADGIAAGDKNVHVLHRTRKEGLGAAYRAGFGWALERGFELLVEMDGDGSHQPEQLPRLLTGTELSDVVLGSRWIDGGAIIGWPRHRRALSRGGSAYARLLLGLEQRDVTGGFRVFTADALRRLDYTQLRSEGYSFQVESLWRASRCGLRITEVPITFVERTSGASKMSWRIVVEATIRVLVWRLQSPGEHAPARATQRAHV
jgi:dolichol-phosphate mannosyltransferase